MQETQCALSQLPAEFSPAEARMRLGGSRSGVALILGDLVKLSAERGTRITIRDGVGYVELSQGTTQR